MGTRAVVPLLLALSCASPCRAQAQGRHDPPAENVPAPPPALGLDDLVRFALAQNPIIGQAQADVDAARGQTVQAGLYPNPMVGVMGEEMGSAHGPGGILTLPMVSQQLVFPGKLRLSQQAAARGTDQAVLAAVRQRYVVVTAVRRGYFEVLAARQRVSVLAEISAVATRSYGAVKSLLEAKQAARIDLLQLELELNRVRADAEAAAREAAAAWRKLAAAVGRPDLPEAALAGTLDLPLPDYELDRDRSVLLASHPDVQAAQVGVERAQFVLDRARRERWPDVTAGAGYMRNNIDRADQWTFQLSLPVPLWNRNQGNILAAEAELTKAAQEVARVRNELAGRLATAYAQYAAARARADRYRSSVLPQARELFDIAAKGFAAGQFDYLRVLQAQRAFQEANLEYVRSQGEAWQAASDVAGLLLEEPPWPAVRPVVGRKP